VQLASDTIFVNYNGYYYDFLLNRDVMSRVSTTGYEDSILYKVCATFNNTKGLKNTPKNVLRIVERLNLLLDRGIKLSLHLAPDWTGYLGRYQIGFNQKSRRFEVVWSVPSLFSERGDFFSPAGYLGLE
jgi:hypothetical protein